MQIRRKKCRSGGEFIDKGRVSRSGGECVDQEGYLDQEGYVDLEEGM